MNKFFASYIIPYKIREYMYRLIGIKMWVAGIVVTKDCEENCLYAGNPARKIKQL